MRKTLLLPGALLLALGVVRCGGPTVQYDDDDDNGHASGKGGTVGGRGGSMSAGTGNGGASGNTEEAGSSPLSAGGATNGARGGADAMGGTRSAGGTRTSEGGAANDAGAAGANSETGSGGDGGSGGLGGKNGSSGAGGSSGTTGTGGTAGSGNSSGKGGKAGSGGSAGSGGFGGMSGSGGIVCGAGLGLALTPAPGAVSGSGWIDGSTDCVGIQGAVYGDSDVVGSYISVDSTGGHVCVSGHSTKVLSGNYAAYWGARVNIQLNNPGDDTAHVYDASSYAVTGFAFTISGTTPPSIIRPTLQVSTSSAQYCESVCAIGEQSLLLSDALSNCYDPVTHITPDPTKLTLLQFYLPSNPTSSVDYDFCIDDLRVLTTSTHLGDPGTCPVQPGPNSCVGHCGSISQDETCYCDSYCTSSGDCCADFATACP